MNILDLGKKFKTCLIAQHRDRFTGSLYNVWCEDPGSDDWLLGLRPTVIFKIKLK